MTVVYEGIASATSGRCVYIRRWTARNPIDFYDFVAAARGLARCGPDGR